MADPILQCKGVLSFANRLKQSEVPEAVAIAEEVIKNRYDSAIEERERWKDACGKVEQLIEVLGSNPQVVTLRNHMSRTAACWDDCAKAYLEFLETAEAESR